MGYVPPVMRYAKPLLRGMYAANRYRPAIRGAIRTGKKMYDSYKSYTNTSKRRRTNTNRLTFQHDFNSQYSRKAAPPRVKRAARKSYNNYKKNQIKSLGQRQRLFTNVSNTVTTPTTFGNSQIVSTVGLYGGISGSLNWGNLHTIANDEGLLTSSGKIQFKSAVLDVQLRNNDDNVLIADVYQIVARKESVQEPGQDWANALTSTAATTGAASYSNTQLGCTPFDAPGFGSQWLIKKKTIYRISPGNSIYLQMRDPRNYRFDTERFNYDGANVGIKMFKFMSQGYMFVLRNAEVDLTIPATPKMLPTDFDLLVSQNYHYCIDESSVNTTGV